MHQPQTAVAGDRLVGRELTKGTHDGVLLSKSHRIERYALKTGSFASILIPIGHARCTVMCTVAQALGRLRDLN
jgi:hypothetical protein